MKEPCIECPFRRESLPGWLGEHQESQELVDVLWRDGIYLCHMEVVAFTENGIAADEAVSRAAACVGGLALMNNSCKLSRDPEIARLQKLVGKRADCFSWPTEMREHHGR